MTANAQEFARQTFQTAQSTGSSERPAPLRQFLARISSNVGELPILEMDSLEQALYSEFSFLVPLIRADNPPDSASSARWVVAVRSVLDGLSNWKSNNAHALVELQALLVTANALDIRSAGLECIASQLAGIDLTVGVLQLIESADVRPFGHVAPRVPDLRQDLKTATQQGNYERLHQLLPDLMPESRSDLPGAIILLSKLDPAKLAKAVVDKNDVLFSMFVCLVLKDSAAQFALRVPLVSFKFVSICNLNGAPKIARTSPGWSDLMRQLLMQVAQTSDWHGWMLALFKYCHIESPEVDALADALVNLEERHWTEFVQVLSLEFPSAAEPVAKLMARFADQVGPAKAKAMWLIAFKRWNEWDYAMGKKHAYMFAPASCALDYPVAMYYAQLTDMELDAEVTRLVQVIEGVEQDWFESASDLITMRNRLLSRVRLVRHARGLVAANAALLPPPIQPDADTYSLVRFHYFDVHRHQPPS